MKVINIHKRKINQSKETIYKLFETLSTKDDKIWPYEKWPAMRFKDGLKVGSHGGHGPIRYYVASITNNESMVFNFTTEGFNGSHSLNIKELNASEVEVSHIINLEVFGSAKWSWIFVIRWLHDALIEDAFDKLENQFSANKKVTTHNFWVKFIRKIKRKKQKA